MKLFNLFNLFLLTKSINAIKNAWFIIDPQNCFENELPIYGATLNNIDTALNINKSVNSIDQLVLLKDTHNNNEINNQNNWINSTGHHPNIYEMINENDIGKKWWPTTVSLEYAKIYSNYLNNNNKPSIIMWPNHCVINTNGHNINDEINKSIQYWEFINNKSVLILEKGLNMYSEQYGILPEARLPQVFNDKNINYLINEVIYLLCNYDNIYFVGDEYSHSVLPTLKDVHEIVSEWLKMPLVYVPNLYLNNNLLDIEEYNIDFFNWVKNKFNFAINNLIEHILDEEL